MRLFVVFVLLFCQVIGENDKFGYDGYKVYRIRPKTKEQNDFLTLLQKSVTNLDFWVETNSVGKPVDVMVSPIDQKAFVDLVILNELVPEIFINDVRSVISKESVRTNVRSGEMSWDSYYRLEDIHAWMESLEAEHPDQVKVISGGRSYEGRDIKGVKISFNAGKRGVFIEGGIHAREWISPATVTYIINELLNGKDPAFKRIAQNFDWYLFPSVNPDGYAFTHDWYRLWRKTRTPYTFFCYGADPNRNWDFHWGEKGTSTNPCHDTYGGPDPFSELETVTLSQFIESIADTLDVYLAFHSYSQILLMPYGHTPEHLDNYDDVYAIGNRTIHALMERYGTEYTLGNIAEAIYEASGGSMDWVKGTHKVPISFTYELRDTGEYGFLLPADQIIPNCEEIVDSLVGLFEEAENLKYFSLD